MNIFQATNVAFYNTKCISGSATGICYSTGNETIIGSSTKQIYKGYINECGVALIISSSASVMFAAGILVSINRIYEALALNVGLFILNLIFLFTLYRDIKFNQQAVEIKDICKTEIAHNKAVSDRELVRLNNELNEIIIRNQGSMDVTWTNEEIQKELDNQIKLIEQIGTVKSTSDYRKIHLKC